jgi:hypothetical protein
LGRCLAWARPGSDPCGFGAGGFVCDAAHDGGAELEVPFRGAAGDRSLLGDLDGDGRDDPCVVRQGRLLCDTAHNGGTAELSFRLSLPGVPLLGNVDGL